MSKYIIELDDRIKLVTSVGVTENGVVYTTSDYVHNLEELNSDYINDHSGSLQDEAYKQGYAEAERIWRAPSSDNEFYQKGLGDAWEAARKIANMWTRIDNDELLAIFGITERIGHSTIRSMFEKQTANEAMLELEAYEEKQKAEDEIKVGDEVETKDGKRFVVTTFGSGFHGDIAVGVCADGLGLGVDLKKLRKTGRHFDIKSILEAMKS